MDVATELKYRFKNVVNVYSLYLKIVVFLLKNDWCAMLGMPEARGKIFSRFREISTQIF